MTPEEMRREMQKALAGEYAARIDAAIGIANVGKMKNANYADATTERGLKYLADKQLDAAIGEFKKSPCVGARDGLVNAYYIRGIWQLMQGAESPAITDFEETVKLAAANGLDHINAKNKLFSAYRDRGFACLGSQDFGNAINAFTASIKYAPPKDPNMVPPYAFRAAAYEETGDYEKAIADYTEALKHEPDNLQVYSRRAGAYYCNKDYAKAILDFSEVIRKVPNHALIYYNRGLAYRDSGDTAHAIADFEKAVALDPSDSDYQDALAGAKGGR